MNKNSYCEKFYRELGLQTEAEKELAHEFLLANLLGQVNGDRKNCIYLSDEEKTQNKPTTMQAFATTKKLELSVVLSWYECLTSNFNLSHMKSICTQERVNGFGSAKNFYEWYINEPLYCYYCGVCEEELEKIYFNDTNQQYKEARQRGKTLEIERIKTAPQKDNVYNQENCALSCYVCNNAKSDFISAEDFKPIAEGIKEFWENQRKKQNQK